MSDISRTEVLKFLCESSVYGNLGLFIGSGFSKAILDEDVALSWGELLVKVSEELNVEIKKLKSEGQSYPELATAICKRIQSDRSCTYKEATLIFKREIARLTAWYTPENKRKTFSPLLINIFPNWIITTNYDLVIESLLPGKYVSLNTDDNLSSPKDLIPIYHLHGMRLKPKSLVISQEDYVELFRPNVYRQIKLSILLRESTTLFMGYKVGDINVRTAMDWSMNVFNKSGSYPNYLIQVLRKRIPKKNAYDSDNGIIFIETDEIFSFLQEFEKKLNSYKKQHKEKIKNVNQIVEWLNDPDEDFILNFIKNSTTRTEIIKNVFDFEPYLSSAIINFLSKCIDKTWKRAEPYGAFLAYKENITILLDFLIKIEFKNMPIALFDFLAESLERVSYYVGDTLGKSTRAFQTWERRKNDIPSKTVKELLNYSKQNSLRGLKGLLEEL